MSPSWDLELQVKAKKLGLLVVPGISCPSEAQEAINFGFRIIKLFPASTLGIHYIKKLKTCLNPCPFVLAAGGLKVNDLNNWLSKGYNAIALGRELIKDQEVDHLLEQWLTNKKTS